jgi:hypothetical protein
VKSFILIFVVFLPFWRKLDPLKNMLASRIDILKFCKCSFLFVCALCSCEEHKTCPLFYGW